MKIQRSLPILLTLAMAMMACSMIQAVGATAPTPTIGATATPAMLISAETKTPTGQPASTPVQAPAVTQTPAVMQSQAITQSPAGTQAQSTANPGPVTKGRPPQSQAAGVKPGGRTQLTHLANLIGYQVLDANGNTLGVASDYIVNTCETYIVYILMQPGPNLHIPAANRVVIPFEAVTINSGVLDGQNKTIQLQLSADQFSGAPTLSSGQTIMPNDWEDPARNFWKNAIRVDGLSTSCGTSGGTVHLDAYATQLMGVNLYDGRNNLLGTVQDAILQPESGQIYFYIVKPAQGDGLVMVPLGNTNIAQGSQSPGATFKLVLLAQPAMFSGAPRITNTSQADDPGTQGKTRQYWNK
jgi:sporulation protein YlmC with PRC-barrel domain